MAKFALITALRDERDNIDRLFDAMDSQSLAPHTWIIIDDGSQDGSAALLEEKAQRYKKGELLIETLQPSGSCYALGAQYARLIEQGMKLLQDREDYLDYVAVGINDADCFPRPNYFESLIHFLQSRPRLGITSGLDRRLDGRPSSARLTWVRGNCRLWRRECLDETGYLVGPSADTTSLCKARLLGWDILVEPNALFDARETGALVQTEYYGRSAHYRGIGPGYALIKGFFDLIRGHSKMGWGYLRGYLSAWLAKDPQIADQQIRNYYRWYPLHLLRELPRERKLRADLRARSENRSL
jgi:glycosyltransferase involved in cell wall biosynthesis